MNFLRLVKRLVYGYQESPYLTLLRAAGCEYGDLERLVSREGVEEALHDLFCHGVYLTLDELKGRRAVVRGSATFEFDPARLHNPTAGTHLPTRTSGSRGTPTPVGLDLGFLRETAVDYRLTLEARHGVGWRHAIWDVPGGTAMVRALRFAAVGERLARWFTQIDPGAAGLHPRYRWSNRLLRGASLLARVPMPGPVHVPLEAPMPIVRWMAEVLQDGATPHLLTFSSSGARLCRAAREAGVDLRGAQMTVSGEPITPARLSEMRASGVDAVPHYGTSEAGMIGHGCLAPEVSDELHLLHDLISVIQPGRGAAADGLPERALLVSSLGAGAPLMLLNVSLGDQGTVRHRVCGCPLGRLGWAIHPDSIRSVEKLTAGGMTFLDADLVRVLEEILPARFGGGCTDYQLVEEEAPDGQPRLRLLVHPVVGPLDPEAVAEAFLAAIGVGPGANRVMALAWRVAGLLRVERRAPEPTPGGKILHCRPLRRRGPEGAGHP